MLMLEENIILIIGINWIDWMFWEVEYFVMVVE